MTPIGVTVREDGDGYSAFLIGEGGQLQRLSPTWQREVKEDQLREFDVPLREKGKTGKVKRMVPVVVGTKLVCGESLPIASERAIKALRLIATGRVDAIKLPKEAA